MPLDDTTGLLDRKVKPEVFSVEDFRDWLAAQPQDKIFPLVDTRNCALAQYTRARGGDMHAVLPIYVIGGKSLEISGTILGKLAYGVPFNQFVSTMGAALARCEAYLSTTSGDGGE